MVKKNLPAITEDAVLIPGQEGSLEKRMNGNPLQYSCLGNPTERGAWQVTVHGVREPDTTEQLSVFL